MNNGYLITTESPMITTDEVKYMNSIIDDMCCHGQIDFFDALDTARESIETRRRSKID